VVGTLLVYNDGVVQAVMFGLSNLLISSCYCYLFRWIKVNMKQKN